MAIFEGIHIKNPGVPLKEATAVMGKHWGWLLAAGIAYVILGVSALMVPVASSLGLTFVLAGFLVASGILHLIQAIKLRHEQGGAIRFLQALLALAIGAVIVWYPGFGMLGITLTLSFYFLVGSTMHWILASGLAPGSPRGWAYVSAMASFVLGVYILMTFPISALWVPGTLLGIEFVFGGTGLVGLAFAARRLYREAKGLDSDKTSKQFPGGLSPTGHAT